MKPANDNPLFLGLDSSTQSFKATLIDSNLKVVHERSVNFEKDLPEFKTNGGVHRRADGLTVTSPTIMWVAALDLLLEGMKKDKCALHKVVAISGSGQQHGSVWFRKGARETLKKLGAGRPLRDQLKDVFSVPDSPIWMDSSTGKQCAEREKALGGAQAVAQLTGSRAYERFTGNQIAKIYQTQPAAYEATERIALVSSFVPSLLVGDYVSIDTSDGSGMNLMNVRTKKWDKAALDCTAPGLERKLGSIAPGHSVAGKIHGYFVEKYGFAGECHVMVFSGDNPCSLAGLRLQRAGDVAISLGTSDTMFGVLADPKPSATEGHIFANPVDPETYMAMICYKNGSLTRQDVRDRCIGGSWEDFARALGKTPPGNNGNIGFFIKEPEITPPILKPGIFLFDGEGRKVESLPPEVKARAVYEGQFLSMRLRGANISLAPSNILATGGASVDKALLRVMADVFGVPVFVQEQASSASLGAAYRALHGWACHKAGKFVPFADVMKAAAPFKKAVESDKKAHEIYSGMLKKYGELEKRVIG